MKILSPVCFKLVAICVWIGVCFNSLFILGLIYKKYDFYDQHYINNIGNLHENVKVYLNGHQYDAGSLTYDNFNCYYQFKIIQDNSFNIYDFDLTPSKGVIFQIQINDDLKIDLCHEIEKRGNYILIIQYYLVVAVNCGLFLISLLFLSFTCGNCIQSPVTRFLYVLVWFALFISLIGLSCGFAGYVAFYENHGIPEKIAELYSLPNSTNIYFIVAVYSFTFADILILAYTIKKIRHWYSEERFIEEHIIYY